MAVILGTNAGFVSVAPSDDPVASNVSMDNYRWACKDTSPSDATTITEIGWWCDNASEESNFEVGLYQHDVSSNMPDARLYVDAVNAKGTAAGWIRVSVNFAISASTIYWIAVQVDNTTTTTNGNYLGGTGRMANSGAGATELPASFGAISANNFPIAIYAVYSGASSAYVTGTIAASSSVSGYVEVYTLLGVTGTIACTSDVSGAVEVSTFSNISGIITCTSGISGAVTVSSNWQTENFAATKRLIVIGNNSLYYESA